MLRKVTHCASGVMGRWGLLSHAVRWLTSRSSSKILSLCAAIFCAAVFRSKIVASILLWVIKHVSLIIVVKIITCAKVQGSAVTIQGIQHTMVCAWWYTLVWQALLCYLCRSWSINDNHCQIYVDDSERAYIQVIKMFSKGKQAHVGMEPSKTSQTRCERHHNTFTPSLHLVPFCQLCIFVVNAVESWK